MPDYANEPVPTPELQSTIFWDPNLNTSTTVKNSIAFYTSDVKEQFTIIIQGVTVNGLIPVFGKSVFTVK